MSTVVQRIHVADAGLDLIATIRDADGVVDLSQADLMQFRFRRPDGTTAQVAAQHATDGTDGRIKMTTTTATFGQPGLWQMQAYVEIGTDRKYSNVSTLRVHANL